MFKKKISNPLNVQTPIIRKPRVVRGCSYLTRDRHMSSIRDWATARFYTQSFRICLKRK